MKLTEAWVSPAIAVTPVGAAGIAMPGGITGALGAEAGLVPEAFVAVTVNVYEVPFTNPLIKTEVGGKSGSSNWNHRHWSNSRTCSAGSYGIAGDRLIRLRRAPIYGDGIIAGDAKNVERSAGSSRGGRSRTVQQA